MKLITPWFPVNETYTWLELNGNAQTVTPVNSRNFRFPVARVPIAPEAMILAIPSFPLVVHKSE